MWHGFMLGIKLLPLSFLFQILVMFALLFKFYSLLKKEKWQTIALRHPHYPFIPADNFLCDHPPQFVTSSFWDCRQRGEKLQRVFPPFSWPSQPPFCNCASAAPLQEASSRPKGHSDPPMVLCYTCKTGNTGEHSMHRPWKSGVPCIEREMAK